jgi:hypothetical protein
VTRLEIPYVQEWFDKRTRKIRRRFRQPGHKSVELPGAPGSEEFTAAYQAAMATPTLAVGAAKRSRPGSVSAAIAAYYTSTLDFLALAPSTQKMRRNYLEKFRADTCGTTTPIGERMVADITPRLLQLYLANMKPFAARNMRKALRHLMAFCAAPGDGRERPDAVQTPEAAEERRLPQLV